MSIFFGMPQSATLVSPSARFESAMNFGAHVGRRLTVGAVCLAFVACRSEALRDPTPARERGARVAAVTIRSLPSVRAIAAAHPGLPWSADSDWKYEFEYDESGGFGSGGNWCSHEFIVYYGDRSVSESPLRIGANPFDSKNPLIWHWRIDVVTHRIQSLGTLADITSPYRHGVVRSEASMRKNDVCLDGTEPLAYSRLGRDGLSFREFPGRDLTR